MINNAHTAAVILAAGKGTRIGSHLPKVLYPLAGRPMVSYILDTLASVKLKDIYVVTGYRSEDVQASINRKAYFVYQPDPLGTGHAVSCAMAEIPPDIDTILVLNGDDSSFYTKETIEKVLAEHKKNNSVISLVTTKVKNPTGLGRIIRTKDGSIQAIREEKSATAEEKLISEVNIGFYVFNSDWIRQTLPKIKPLPGHEIYLVDVVAIAHLEGKKVNNIQLPNCDEWSGVNTQEELILANNKMINLRHAQLKGKTNYIFDLDDMLISTDKLKFAIEAKIIFTVKNVFTCKLSDTEIKKLFWQVYAEHKRENGWVSTPELGAQLASIYKIKDGASTFKRLLYTLPFGDYIKPGAKELLSSLKGKGNRTILAYGDLVYQPIKISIFSDYIDNYHVYETLNPKMIAELRALYKDSSAIMIEDKLSTLYTFSQSIPDLTTIWMTGGPYQSKLAYTPTYTINSIGELAQLLTKI